MKEFRPLVGNDIFKLSRILKKMEIKFDVKEGMTQEQLGAELIMKAFENLHLAQKEVNEFMGSLIGIDGKAFGELPISEYFEYLEKFKDIKNIKSFFTQAEKLT